MNLGNYLMHIVKSFQFMVIFHSNTYIMRNSFISNVIEAYTVAQTRTKTQ